MRLLSVVKVGGAMLAALTTALFAANDSIQALGLDNRQLFFLSFIIFAILVFWGWYSSAHENQQLQDMRPKPRLGLVQEFGRWIIEVVNDGESAQFEAQGEVVAQVNITSALPKGRPKLSWDDDSWQGPREIPIHRGGQHRLVLAHHYPVTRNSVDTQHTNIFLGGEFITDSNSRGTLTLEEDTGGAVRAYVVRLTILTKPSVVGEPVSQCYRIDSVGNAAEVDCNDP